MKLDLAHVVDWLDHAVLRHRFSFVCWIAVALFGDGQPCECSYCRGFR